MDKSVFNTEFQQRHVAYKTVVGLERISEVFRTLLWEHGKQHNLSPIQIQILIFIAYHKEVLCTVSHLALEFNVTKPTISDAVKVLLQKDLIKKTTSSSDSRSYAITLSAKGQKLVKAVENFADPIKDFLMTYDDTSLGVAYELITKLIKSLNAAGVLSVQRHCFNCRFFGSEKGAPFCAYLNETLQHTDIRIDCPEFESV